MRVLLLEEDVTARRFIRNAVARLGYAVDPACDGENGRWFLRHRKYVMLIASDTCPAIQLLLVRGQAEIPTLITSFQSSALEGDRQLKKPFTEEDLVEAVNALITLRAQHLFLGGLEVDFRGKRVLRERHPVALSRLEFKLFELLARRAGATISRSEIFEHVFRRGTASRRSNVVDVYIGYLRVKLGRSLIQTIKGQGYLLDPTAGSDAAD